MSDRDNSTGKKFVVDDAPDDGEVFQYDIERDEYVSKPLPESVGGGETWVKASYSYSDFVTGRETEEDSEIVVETFPIDTIVEGLIVRRVTNVNDPDMSGDAIGLQLILGTEALIDTSWGFDHPAPLTHSVNRATIDDNTFYVLRASKELKIRLIASQYGAHTMGDITSGTLEVYYKVAALPV